MKPEERLIVALDFDNWWRAEDLVLELPNIKRYKVGWQLFMSEGLEVIDALSDHGKKVFLDLKLDDIPNTVNSAIRNTSAYSIEFFSLQGDLDTYQAAKSSNSNIKFLFVPSLSSQRKKGFNVKDICQMDGVVASGAAVRTIKIACPHVTIVTPGIRRSKDPKDDHRRPLTPTQAIKEGADYIVVGRPIRNSPNPKEEAESIIEEIKEAIKDERKR